MFVFALKRFVLRVACKNVGMAGDAVYGARTNAVMRGTAFPAPRQNAWIRGVVVFGL